MTTRESVLSLELEQQLKLAAEEVSRRAWCPYSRFPVGAAVLTEDGSVFTGCNVENASSGLTICAERNAIFQAVAAGQCHVLAIVVFTPTPNPTAPCGACRQVIAEFGPRAEILCVCSGADVLRVSLGELLPHHFGPDSLVDAGEKRSG